MSDPTVGNPRLTKNEATALLCAAEALIDLAQDRPDTERDTALKIGAEKLGATLGINVRESRVE